jgi:hypothetical protein
MNDLQRFHGQLLPFALLHLLLDLLHHALP